MAILQLAFSGRVGEPDSPAGSSQCHHPVPAGSLAGRQLWSDPAFGVNTSVGPHTQTERFLLATAAANAECCAAATKCCIFATIRQNLPVTLVRAQDPDRFSFRKIQDRRQNRLDCGERINMTRKTCSFCWRPDGLQRAYHPRLCPGHGHRNRSGRWSGTGTSSS